MALFLPPANDIWTAMDILKMSDVALFVMPTLEPISEVGRTLLQCAKDQGCPSKFLGVSTEFTKTEEKQFLKSVSKILQLEKIYPLINPGQISNLLRMMTVSKIQTPKQYDIRSGMLIESAEVLHLNQDSFSQLLPYLAEDPDSFVSTVLQVTGHIRKRNMNPHRPVHIPGHGNYQILRVDVTPINDVKSLQRSNPDDMGIPVPTIQPISHPRFMYNPRACPQEETDAQMDDTMSVGTQELEMSQVSADIDLMNEEDEMEVPKRFPKGTSEYQADWLADSDSEREKEIFDEDDELESLKGSSSEEEESELDEEMDWAEEQKQLQLAKGKLIWFYYHQYCSASL